MAQTAQLLTLLLLFLTALLIHYFLTTTEGFTTSRTRLTKENVKALLDSYIQDSLKQYQTLKDLRSSDPRIKIRLQYWAKEINTMNDQYPFAVMGIDQFDYSKIPGLFLEDLTLIKDFMTKTVGIVYTSSSTTPANASDIDTFSSRLQSIFSIGSQKAALAGIQITPEIQADYRKILTNLQTLRRNIPTMQPNEIPLFKSDIYAFALPFADANFVPPTDATSQGTDIRTDNLPKAQSATQLVAQAVVGPVAPSTPTTVPLSPSVPVVPTAPTLTPTTSTSRQEGMRFSELVKMLMTYTNPTTASTPTQAPKAQTQAVEPAPTDMTKSNASKDLKKLVSEEVDSRLKNFMLTPKDQQNSDIVNRSRGSFTQGQSCYTSNGLEQGAFFRGQSSSAGCPTITPEAAQPYPIDMNDYIRKDSIPCYGCNLK